ncbi:MAG: FHA domain-containing protein [Bacteroides sp.]|nr:FHA domain-containing protein [Bacteroides sp.]MCM1094848.1 FHA domain-containing protein [Terasakiella sp.]
MPQSTQKYSRSLSGSIGAGMKSLVGGGGRRYYILEHKVSSKYHKAGENQTIIVDQIELGRDPACQVRFDESFGTVSRRHAAIIKDGDNWKLVQLSKTNPTYLNGHKVDREWYLQNGDEIRLSTNGPRLGFIVPEGDKGLVKSIGLTRRMSLFRQQALRPYKRAIVGLSCVLALCLAGGIWKITTLDNRLEEKSRQIVELIGQNTTNRQVADSLAQELVETNRQMGDYESRMKEMARETEAAKRQAARAQQAAAAAERRAADSGIAPSGALKEQCFPHTYAIYQVKQVLNIPGASPLVDEDPQLVGTGFLLSDGRFISARHVIEPHYYFHYSWPEGVVRLLFNQNVVVNNGGDIETTFVAISHSGDRIGFTSKQCRIDRSGDTVDTFTSEDGKSYVVRKSDKATADWISINTGKTGMPFDAALSSTLPVGTTLQILGFPNSRGGEDPAAVSPISSHAEVARDGLDVNGTIMTSNDDTQSGNSGGPVFVYKDGRYTVVGILSGTTGEKGRVVPINAAR